MIDTLLFQVFPYVAISIEIAVSVFRYRLNSYKFTSLSSEFLEANELFWGTVPWHYGIIVVLFGHILAFMFPETVIAFNRVPVRLLIFEVTALIFGLMALFGLIVLIHRRLTNERVKVVTSRMDVFILFLLLVQVVSGVATAIFYRWGSVWYATSLVPYLKSVFMLKPNLTLIVPMPWTVKLHVFNAFLIVAVLPFTRLLHFLVLPIPYLWRGWQLVIWNWDRKKMNRS